MAPAGKALGFYNEANDWFCNAELPSDLIVIIDGVNFNLHKFPLLSRCGEIEKLIKETQDNDKGTCIISLEDIPGGANGFLVAAKFCYGVHVELTPRNIVMVYCLADYLEMIDEYGDDNLFSKAGNYFYKNILKNWNDCMVALQSCEILETKIDNLNIVGKCLDAITVMVCRDPSHLQSPGGSILWNGINTGARIQTPETDWWFEDVSHLRVALFEKLIKTMEAKGIQPENLTGAIIYYCGKCLPGLGRWQEALPQSSRSLNDGLYRAVDIYIETHPWLTEKEKEDPCNIINCQKLSIDACAHASQNEHLPLRFALQVLFFEQMHLKTALEGYLNLLDIENNPTDPMAIVPHDSHRDGWVSLVRENQVLRDGMESMRTRVRELEQEFNSLRQEIKKMNQTVVL